MDTGRPPFRYDARLASEIELRWQDRWEREGTFHAANPAGDLSAGALSAGFGAESGRPKFYLLDFFPYPSGIGLHVGHPLGYIGTDVFGRYLRMTGHHVLHPFGFDTFGLPAEQYAVDTGQHPAVTVRQNADVMRRQLRRLGLGHDRRREIMTSDPSAGRSGSSCASSAAGTTRPPAKRGLSPTWLPSSPRAGAPPRTAGRGRT